MGEEWYVISNVDALDTPALVVYPERVAHNIALLKSMIGDVQRLRPHIKTHKSPEVTRMMLDAGITKYKCATIAEAEMLGMCQVPDVLLAYQPNGPKISRFFELVVKYPGTRYSCLIDNLETAKTIAELASRQNMMIDVFIDLNVGMNRTGINPARAFELYRAVSGLPSLRLRGLHAYDGHIHDADFSIRHTRLNKAIAPITKLQSEILAAGYPTPKIVAGGSPTYPIIAKDYNYECSPGTFAYWDRGYQLAFEEQPFNTAALIIARVVSLPGSNKICIDVGHKSVSAENELAKRIYFLNAPELVFTGQSEEHLIADAGEGHSYRIGDVFYGLPYHICPTVALYERSYTVENQELTSEWLTTARDRKISI